MLSEKKLFVNNLTVIDFSWLDESRGLTGESWIVDIILGGSLNQESVIMDFSRAKKCIKAIIDQRLDHTLLVPGKNPAVHVSHGKNRDTVQLRGADQLTCCFVSAPLQAFCHIDSESITQDSVADFLQDIVAAELPPEVTSVKIILRQENITGANYHYSHGLKKHDGNCQRIAHGHRSAIKIFTNDERCSRWEQYWAERWQDAYLVSQEDIVDLTAMSAEAQICWHPELITSRYRSTQGEFEIMVPHRKTEVMPGDTTVECIAEYIRQEICYLEPDTSVTVHAYEGVDKGAIA